MNKKTWAVVGGLIAAFVLGWLGAEVRNIHKLPLADVIASKWHGSVFTLVKNARNLEFVDPATTQNLIGTGLDIESAQLAEVYDGLSPEWKKRVVFDLPAARKLAEAQDADKFFSYGRQHLLIFVECVQKVQSQGGSVRACAIEHPGWRAKPQARPGVPASTPDASSAASPPAH